MGPMDRNGIDPSALEGKTPEEVLRWAAARFPGDTLALATSFGVEDQVLIHMAAKLGMAAHVFTLDTGRLFPEVHGTMQRTMEAYRIPIEVYAPEAPDVADLVREKGPNLFYGSPADRHRCCEVRKIRPLRKALQGRRAWVTGLRRGQSQGRSGVLPASWDEAHGLWKICPLAALTERDVWEYAERNNVPVCPLQRKGFRSLGCAPCTRAIGPDDDLRSGRWWWEEDGRRECGLHTAQDRAQGNG